MKLNEFKTINQKIFKLYAQFVIISKVINPEISFQQKKVENSNRNYAN